MPYATILGIAPRGSLGSGPPTDHPFHPTISIGPGDRKNRSDPWAVPRKKNFQPFHALILPCTGSTPPLQSIFRGALKFIALFRMVKSNRWMFLSETLKTGTAGIDTKRKRMSSTV